MKCPKCGADNPEGALYCSLCLQMLSDAPQRPAATVRQEHPSTNGESYVAPGEWKGDARIAIPYTSTVIASKKRKLQLKTVLLTGLAAMVLLWIVLSFTVWGNPTPGDRTMQFIETINQRDMESFSEVITPESRSRAEDLYYDIVYYLGNGGALSHIKLEVVQDNNYDARSYIVEGSVSLEDSSEPISITRDDNLVVILKNHKGTWYVDPQGTDLTP